MLRLEKNKLLDKLSKEEKASLILEIHASQRLCKLFSAILEDRLSYYDSKLESLLEKPSELAGAVQCRAELKRLTNLFKTTEK